MQVQRIEDIEQFRTALIQFLSAAEDSLLAVDLELRRFVDWLRAEQPRRLDRAYIDSMEKVAQARTALQRKMILLPGERPPDIIEEQKALKLAQRRREDLEDRIKQVRKWARMIEPILDDYRGESRQLANMIEGDPPPALRFIDTALAQLRAYLDVPHPDNPTPTTSPASVGIPEVEIPTEPTPSQVQEPPHELD